MTSRWTFYTVPDTDEYLLSISFCMNSCFLRKPALLKHEALQFYTISSRTRYLHANGYHIVFLLMFNEREKKSMQKLKRPRAHFKDRSKRVLLSLFLADTAQLPVILSWQCQAPYWVFSCPFSLWIYLSLSLYLSISDSKLQRASECTSLTVISHCFLIMFSAHCLQCVLKFE